LLHSAATKELLSIAASVPKPYLRGKRNGMSGRTGNTNPNFKDGSSPDRQRLYASSEWRAILRAVYARDDYRCRRCGSEKLRKRWLHAHHISPWAGNPTLRFDLANLVTLCRPCHSWVHSKANRDREYLG
jgi:5-methylcytosine-specific restriction endonuclease McrA